MVKIVYAPHTEYHLLLAINDIVNHPYPLAKDEVIFLLFENDNKRLNNSINVESLPGTVMSRPDTENVSKKITREENSMINRALALNPVRFVFFQEMDPFMHLLAKVYRNKDAVIDLFQDGYKPYNHPIHSPSLLLHQIRTILWVNRLGHFYFPLGTLFRYNRYANIKTISRIFLTHPNAYRNWANHDIWKIKFDNVDLVKEQVKDIFRLNEEKLEKTDGIVLYLNQPMHHDIQIDIEFLKELREHLNVDKVFLKLHPLTVKEHDEKLRQEDFLSIIDIEGPAEWILLTLKNSIVISTISTSMLLESENNNNYYYAFKLFYKKIQRLQKYRISNIPSTKIIAVDSIKQIQFPNDKNDSNILYNSML